MAQKLKRKFLIFSPHPDDLEFWCAGTVARLTKEGNEVIYCVVTNGEKGTHKIKQSKKSMIAMREREQLAAAKVVGVHKVIFLGEIDGELECTKVVRKKIVKVMRQVKPNIVLSLDSGNRRFDNFYLFHHDHRVTAEIIFDSLYPACGSDAFFPELAKEGALPHQIDEAWFFGTDKPNFYSNITKTIDRKIQALQAYESQTDDIERVKQWIYLHARKVGKKKNMKYAESFRRLTFL